MNCYDCKYYDTDYEFDGEDEYEIGICEAGHNEYLDSDEECPYFKKYRQRKYVEKNTKCDVCEYLSECMDKGEYIDCTDIRDIRTHVLCTMDNCKKMNL